MARIPIVLAIVLLLSGCSVFGDSDTSDLDVARARWAQAEISDYDYELAVSCFCLGAGTYLVEVRNREVSNVTPITVEVPPSTELAEKTIEDLFTELAGAYAQNAAAIEVTYNSGLGYPTSIMIDYNHQTADDEINYIVDNFERAN